VNDNENPSLLTFPCDFTIKVFGKDDETFETTVLGIIRAHVAEVPQQAIQSRLSENGKYKALSVTIQATSKEQLDAIYQALSASPDVLMAL